MFAFNIESFEDNSQKDSEEFVEFNVQLWNSVANSNGFTKQKLRYHLCNLTDLYRFYPSAKQTKSQIEILAETANFYCIDTDQPITLSGDWSTESYSVLTIDLIPCQSNFAAGKVCNKTKEETADYLNFSQFQLIYNSERIDQYEYGESKLKKEALIKKFFFSPDRPQYAPVKIQRHEQEENISPFHMSEVSEFVDYIKLKMDRVELSIYDDFPTNFKYMGVDIEIDLTGYISQREVYTYLELMGNIGGLSECCILIGKIFVWWISNRHSDFKLVRKLFQRTKPSYKRQKIM